MGSLVPTVASARVDECVLDVRVDGGPTRSYFVPGICKFLSLLYILASLFLLLYGARASGRLFASANTLDLSAGERSLDFVRRTSVRARVAAARRREKAMRWVAN